ncbi:molecular chaperone [Pectobacterium parmentieri]|uniref:fimbrial biogenesis chaperone n=1 Tax=Pectobacterium parmentieri TaxID=1905730 RepID=UPI0018DFA62F|nr:fimbria/pilus periplasmic chaperone [Pectobacterium parmentieri]MBI0550218.1 fimbria/pilus periplasmic chaperone [Pectobacterium parmentieri]MBI0563404.1 fimbria/pilus periplasmic chaperone [Pectobacterium parmentieri]
MKCPFYQRAAGFIISYLFLIPSAYSTLSLDRTRVIFNDEEQSATVMLMNPNAEHPILAHSWLTDDQHNKVTTPLMVLPPLQRIEAKGYSLTRLVKTEQITQLPTDRESLFYLNVREILPKTEKVNVLQIAIQSEIKVFFRPRGVKPGKDEIWQKKLLIKKTGNTFQVENPTPYYITVSSILKQPKTTHSKPANLLKRNAFMVAPRSTLSVEVNNGAINHFYLYYVNDHGAYVPLPFTCAQNQCQPVPHE